MPELIPSYRFEVMSRADPQPFIQQIRSAIFAQEYHLPAGYAYSDAEQEAVWKLSDRLTERVIFAMGMFQAEAFIGWHISNQSSESTLEMTSTGILQEHRRHGLYTALVPVVLTHAGDLGFQTISSRHNATK